MKHSCTVIAEVPGTGRTQARDFIASLLDNPKELAYYTKVTQKGFIVDLMTFEASSFAIEVVDKRFFGDSFGEMIMDLIDTGGATFKSKLGSKSVYFDTFHLFLIVPSVDIVPIGIIKRAFVITIHPSFVEVKL